MFTKKSSFSRASLVIGFIIITTLSLNACTPQPTPIPTSVPPTQILPSPTAIPPTLDPDLVSSLDEIVGNWQTRGGGGTLIFEIREDESYRFRYLATTEGGVTNVDWGNITISGNEIHLESKGAACGSLGMVHGFYNATLILENGKPYSLKFTAVRKDECSDRQNSVSRDMKYFVK